MRKAGVRVKSSCCAGRYRRILAEVCRLPRLRKLLDESEERIREIIDMCAGG